MASLVAPFAELGIGSLTGVLAGLLLLCCEIGFRCGRLVGRRRGHAEVPGIGTVTAGMLGLLAFTLGLSVSIAQGRFDTRRGLVVQEANAIGTAWLRAGLVEGPEGPELRRLLTDYTRLRLDYAVTSDAQHGTTVNAESSALQSAMWQRMTALAQRAPNPVTASLAAALNDVFDMSLAQRFAYESRVPAELLWMLLAGSILSIGALGYQLGLGGHRFPLLSTLLILMWVGGMVLITDMSRPREGYVRIDPRPLIWTLQGFGSPAPSR